jgi:DNA polymerase-1
MRETTEGAAYVQCPLTGRRHVADDGKVYALVNYMVQGLAAAVFKRKTVELAAAGFDDRLILGVHDEVVLDLHNDELEDAIPRIREIMTDTDTFSVPLTAGVSTGFRWGEKVDVQDHDQGVRHT